MPLFTAEQLGNFLQYQVEDAPAAMAEKVVSGWLSDAAGSVTFPDPLPPQLFSWAIELGAIAHENPGGLASETTGAKNTTWDRARRAEILGYVARWAGNDSYVSGAGVPSPVGSFPPARPYPDPVERC